MDWQAANHCGGVASPTIEGPRATERRDFPPAKAPFRRDRHSAGGPLREIRPIGALGSAVIRPAMARHPETGGMRTKSAAGKGRKQAKSRGSACGNGFGSLSGGRRWRRMRADPARFRVSRMARHLDSLALIGETS